MPWDSTTASSRITSTYAYREARLTALKRDAYTCQLAYPDICQGHATETDHITPVAAGGPIADPSALQAVCRPCHARKTSRDAAAGRARALQERRPPPPHPGLL